MGKLTKFELFTLKDVLNKIQGKESYTFLFKKNINLRIIIKKSINVIFVANRDN